MKQRGIFGAAVLVAGIQILLLMHGLSAGTHSAYERLGKNITQIEQALLKRTETELLADSAVKNAILESAALGALEGEAIKLNVNRKIIPVIENSGGGKKGICSENFDGTEKIEKTLSPEELGEISKVSIIKAGGVARIKYFVSGGIEGNLFPCAEIRAGNFTVFFRLPVNYSAASEVIMP